jgi:hypothetical protein
MSPNHARIKPSLEEAIAIALAQVRTELNRLYANDDVGTITLHCGKGQIKVRATPERLYEPVQFEQ